MSAIGWKGRELQVYLDEVLIAAVRAKRVEHVNAPIDASDGEDNGWRLLLDQAETHGIEVAVDGVATSENYALLLEAYYADELVDLHVLNPEGTAELGEGAFMRSLEAVGEHRGHVAFSAVFTMSAELDTIPPPVLIDIDPDEENAEEPGFVMTLTGSGFRPDSVGWWNGFERATVYVSATELQMTVLEADIAVEGTALVQVKSPRAQPSNGLVFTILPVAEIPVVVAVRVGGSARSLDNGRTWANSTTPIFVSGTNVRDDVILAIYDSTRVRFYAFGGNGNRSRWTSTDGGDNWTETQNSLPSVAGISIIDGLYIEAHDALIVVGSANDGANARIFVSHDGGSTWTSIIPTGTPTDHEFRGIAYDPDSDEVFAIAGPDSGSSTGEYHCPASELATQASWTYVADDLGDTVVSSAGLRRGAAYFPPTGRGLVGMGEISSFQDGQVGCSQPANDYDGNWFLVSVGTLNNGDCVGLCYFPPLEMMFGIWDAGTSTGGVANMYGKSINPHSGPWSLVSVTDQNQRSPRYMAETQEVLIPASGRFYYSSDLTNFTEVTHAGAWQDVAEGYFINP